MRTDVLIIGAGLSGLAAGRRLRDNGFDVVLAEARARLGGRILSTEAAGLDLGPAWFWPGQDRIAALVSELGLRAFKQYSQGATVFEDRGGAVRRDLTFALNGDALRVEGGLGRLIEGLAAAVPKDRVLLQTVATRINGLGNGWRVELQRGDAMIEVFAQAVVIATPPRVAARDIRFTPALPTDASAAIQHIPTWMAGHAKALAVFARPFWRDAGLSGDVISHRGPLVQIHDASPADGRVGALFGFVGLDPSGRSRIGDAALSAGVREQLVSLFGEEAASPAQLRLMDWSQERFTATEKDFTPLSGHPTYGMPSSLEGLARDGLVFASTELAREHGGLLEGALASAERGADLIQQRLMSKASA